MVEVTHEQFMVCKVVCGAFNFKIAVIYGLHTIVDRKHLWNDLKRWVISTFPMIIIGDFNVVWHSEDRLNGTIVCDPETEDLEIFLLETSLVEAKSTGPFYSWSISGIGADIILSGIDKAFVNSTWFLRYNDVAMQYLSPWVSDHSPLIFNMAIEIQEGGRPFRFINALTEHEDFLDVVTEAWGFVHAGYKLKSVWVKLKVVKKALKNLHQQKFDKALEKVEDLRQQLVHLQTQASYNTNVVAHLEEKELLRNMKYWSRVH